VRLLGVLVALEKGVRLSEQEQTRRTGLLKEMLVRGLQDVVASVRDAAVQVMPAFSRAWKSARPKALGGLLGDIRTMASDSKFSRRMTFVACQHQLLLEEDVESMVRDQVFWRPLERLASDKIVGVRIGVARLLNELCDKHCQDTRHKPQWVLDLIGTLRADSSKDVRAFILPILDPIASSRPARPAVHRYCSSDLPMPHTFSRPPPVTTEEDTSVNTERSPKPNGAGFHDSSAATGMDDSRTTNVLAMGQSPTPKADAILFLHDSQFSQFTPSRPTLLRTESEQLRALASDIFC